MRCIPSRRHVKSLPGSRIRRRLSFATRFSIVVASLAVPSGAAAQPIVSRVTSPNAQDTLPLLLVARGVNDKAHVIERVVEPSGTIVDRTIDPITGRIMFRRSLGNVLRMPAIQQRSAADGALVRTVQDASGAILELTFNAQGVLSGMRALQLGSSMTVTVLSVIPKEQVAAGGRIPAVSPEFAAPTVTGANVSPTAAPLATASVVPPTNAAPQAPGPVVPPTNAATQAPGPVVPPTNAASRASGPVIRRTNAAPPAPTISASPAAIAVIAGMIFQNPTTAAVSTAAPPPATASPPSRSPAALSASRAQAQITGPPILALLSQGTTAAGQVVQRVVDPTGKIMVRVADETGRIVQQREVGNLLQLPILNQKPQANGQVIVVARDATGSLIEMLLAADKRIMRVRPVGGR